MFYARLFRVWLDTTFDKDHMIVVLAYDEDGGEPARR
jgi:hypothetical protein